MRYIICTCRFRGYFKSLFDGSDSTIEIGITGGKYATEHTVEKHVCFLVGELLQGRTLEAPYAARSIVGDGQLLEDIVEASGRRRGCRWCRGRRRWHL